MRDEDAELDWAEARSDGRDERDLLDAVFSDLEQEELLVE
jgi:hypothetical protein